MSDRLDLQVPPLKAVEFHERFQTVLEPLTLFDEEAGIEEPKDAPEEPRPITPIEHAIKKAPTSLQEVKSLIQERLQIREDILSISSQDQQGLASILMSELSAVWPDIRRQAPDPFLLKASNFQIKMQKAKKYDWKDSNIALFGSATEKKVKKDSANSEPAWNGSGEKVGLRVWRIVKFKVTDWPKEDYGEFYNGDSYIVLNTYKKPGEDELLMDVHFWIGKYSSQDEYATAAYKTVELDTFLDDKPVQHREVMGHESSLFSSYFTAITLLKGGADTGFRRVVPEVPKTRLYHVKGTTMKNTKVTEVAAKRGNLNNDDVFIIDTYSEIWQYNGENADKDEVFKATQYIQGLKSQRAGKVKKSGTTNSSAHPAIQKLAPGESKKKAAPKVGEKKLFRLSDAGGKLEFEETASGGDITKDKFNSDDVFIFDRGDHCFVWVGKHASVDERKNSLSYGSNHLNKSDHPWVPLTVLAEGAANAEFDGSF